MYFNIRKIIVLLSLSFFLFALSCTKEEQEIPKSMDEIHEEEGLPVNTIIIEKTGFSKSLNFYAPLKGYKQTTKGAMIADEVIKINANLGDYVEEGKIIMEFPPNNSTMQFKQAKTALESAEKTYNRMKSLLEAGEISQQQYDNVETQYLVSKRNYEQMKQILFVEAPISGNIISMPLRVGDVPKMETELFTIAQLHKMVALVDVTEKEIGMFKKGMRATAHYNGNSYDGKVTDIPLAMNQMTRSFPVEIQIDNPGRALKSGVSVDISVDIVNTDSTIVIPRNVISEENGEHYVYVSDGSYAKKTYIEIGQESGIEVEVINGLAAGNRLINCCKNMLEDGIKIKEVN